MDFQKYALWVFYRGNLTCVCVWVCVFLPPVCTNTVVGSTVRPLQGDCMQNVRRSPPKKPTGVVTTPSASSSPIIIQDPGRTTATYTLHTTPFCKISCTASYDARHRDRKAASTWAHVESGCFRRQGVTSASTRSALKRRKCTGGKGDGAGGVT